jgi:hypothetical protein
MSHPDPKVRAFEEEFERSCRAHGINAAFVIAKDDGAKGSLLIIGGAANISDFIERALAPNTVEAQQPKH